MASKAFFTILVLAAVIALATAMAFDNDEADEELDLVLDLLEKRSDEIAFETDDEISNDAFDMEKRGQGRGRFFREYSLALSLSLSLSLSSFFFLSRSPSSLYHSFLISVSV